MGRRHNWGEDRILYRDSQGYLASVPTGWTSVAPEDPYAVLGGGRSPFRITDLLELAPWSRGCGHEAGGGGGAAL